MTFKEIVNDILLILNAKEDLTKYDWKKLDDTEQFNELTNKLAKIIAEHLTKDPREAKR